MSAKTKTGAIAAAIVVLLTAGILIGRASNGDPQDKVVVTPSEPPVSPPDFTADDADNDTDTPRVRRRPPNPRRGDADSDNDLAADDSAGDDGPRIRPPTKGGRKKPSGARRGRRGDRDAEPDNETPKPKDERRGGATGVVDA
jgi:hypothetical protein